MNFTQTKGLSSAWKSLLFNNPDPQSDPINFLHGWHIPNNSILTL
ncbi:hypothetical protein CLOSTMETH_01578 [[Clostridium] methylpentosum DSM 5476]|uniref:Uncharacterized protein n=1 Tax=[Clostridium] methylpentosum DSM 5476 TaxID=537013 RepID=C0ECK7_9FIRM|nr:hypothetical protein CLOSTMETH_01578 [[Clostridium] methylpentosum DSM 5476]